MVYLFRGQKCAHYAGWNYFTQCYNGTRIQNPVSLSVPVLVIPDIQITFIVVLLSIEHVCFIYLWFSNVGNFFLIIIRIKPEGAAKVENGGETVLKSELGIRHKGRTGSEIEN